jgi:hypothetical protein
MYFTYCQTWIPLVARAFYDDFVTHRPMKWAKTEGLTSATAPAWRDAGSSGNSGGLWERNRQPLNWPLSFEDSKSPPVCSCRHLCDRQDRTILDKCSNASEMTSDQDLLIMRASPVRPIEMG